MKPLLVACVLAGCTTAMPTGPPAGTLAPAPGDPEIMLGLDQSGWPIRIETSRGTSSDGRAEITATAQGWTRRTPWSRTELIAHADGSILTTSRIDRDENVLIVFEPPLPVLPATLAHASQSLHEASGNMRVHAGDGLDGLQLAQGQWTLQLERTADIDTADGPLASIVGTFRADLGVSAVLSRSEAILNLHHGPMQETIHVRRTVLGIPRESWRRWMRIDVR